MTKQKAALQKKISFRLDGKDLKRLEKYAEEQGISMSLVVRHLVARFLQDHRDYGESVSLTTSRLQSLPWSVD
jgi:predicted urease superfamily metal-dependent hydrolase